MDYLLLLFMTGAVLMLGYAGRIIFQRTGFPDIIWLLLAGLLIGPVTHLIDPLSLMSITEFVSSLAVVILLFGGGLSLRFRDLMENAGKGLLFMVARFIAGMVVVAAAMLFFGYGILQSLLMGIILGGVSFAVVVPLTKQLGKLTDKARTVLWVGSIVDNLTLVLAFAVMDVIMLSAAHVQSIPQVIAASFSTAVLAGLLAGWACVRAIKRFLVPGLPYIAVLAALLLVYSSMEFINASGAIAVFVFGIVIGNSKTVLKLKKEGKKIEFFHLAEPQRLLTFFMHTFFFVFVGALIQVESWNFIVTGAAIAVALFIAQQIAVSLLLQAGAKFKKYDLQVIRFMIPVGLSAAVISNLVAAKNIPGTEGFLEIVFTVILLTVLTTTLGVYHANHRT